MNGTVVDHRGESFKHINIHFPTCVIHDKSTLALWNLNALGIDFASALEASWDCESLICVQEEFHNSHNLIHGDEFEYRKANSTFIVSFHSGTTLLISEASAYVKSSEPRRFLGPPCSSILYGGLTDHWLDRARRASTIFDRERCASTILDHWLDRTRSASMAADARSPHRPSFWLFALIEGKPY